MKRKILLLFLIVVVVLFNSCTSKKDAKEEKMMELIDKMEINDFHFVLKYDYDEALEEAKSQNKPLILYFTSLDSNNSLDMENEVLVSNRINRLLKEDYVIVRLRVDDKTKFEEPKIVEEDGVMHKFNTLGEEWTYMAKQKYYMRDVPYFVMLDVDGTVLGSMSYNMEIQTFIDFLNRKYSEDIHKAKP